ncbi:MAG TPA: type II CAAX endopeptidase family protein [Kofleriaceae bacterium]|nr:type II CAAX endopeptidase family protein [Kofleriaceae bacterium]
MKALAPGAAVIAALIVLALALRHAARLAELWDRGLGGCAAVLQRLPGLRTRPLLQQRILGVVRGISPLYQWRAIDAETVREPGEAGATSLQIVVVLVTVAASLTLQEYLGGHDTYERLFPPDGSYYWELRGFAWWSGWRVLGYVIIPMIVLACLPGQRISDYHISARGFVDHLWIYGVMFALILPAVLAASTTHAFRETYPFYRIANRSYADLAMWEVLYAIQFLSLEFFFRGFILHGLRRALGANAIFVMIVPYCMIHYGKPLPETLGAIGAGLILGTLAMRTRSIWGGVLIHVGVATTMDVLALRGCPPIGGRPCH